MPVSMELREQGHVTYYVLADPWLITDLTSLYPRDNRYRNTVDFKVHTVMNFGDVRHIPANVITAKQDAPAFEHPASGQLLMIGANSFVRIMAETIFRLAHYKRASFYNTEAEAWAYIRQVIAEESLSIA
ncbi:MAG: hypothetical protein ABI947_05840 [Chloroflexota bacterium]